MFSRNFLIKKVSWTTEFCASGPLKLTNTWNKIISWWKESYTLGHPKQRKLFCCGYSRALVTL